MNESISFEGIPTSWVLLLFTIIFLLVCWKTLIEPAWDRWIIRRQLKLLELGGPHNNPLRLYISIHRKINYWRLDLERDFGFEGGWDEVRRLIERTAEHLPPQKAERLRILLAKPVPVVEDTLTF